MKIIYYDEKYLLPCAQLFMNHYNQSQTTDTFTKERACAYLQEHIFKPRFVGFLLLKKDVLIGFAFTHLRTWSATDDLHIDELIMDNDYQRKGLGTKLLTFIESYAKNFKLSGITVSTNAAPLTQFFQKSDFKTHEISFLYKGFKHTE